MRLESTPVRIPLLRYDGVVVGYTLVDTADADWVNQWTWRLLPGTNTNYANRGQMVNGTSTKILLHRELLGLPRYGRNPQVDHENGDGLDNQRSNLRVVTQAQNQQNQRKARHNTSGYRGVHRHLDRWIAAVRLNGKLHHIGLFSDPAEANEAVIAWRREHMPWATN